MTPFKIAYIDDELDLCELFQDNFESEKFEVAVYVDPKAGIQGVVDHRPDLVIIDYRLPETTGDLIAREMDPSIPKILVTGDLSVDPMPEFIHIMHKPFSFSELESIIETLIMHQEMKVS